MEGTNYTSRLVPVDLLFSGEDIVSPDAPDADRFGHLALAPVTNISPYIDALKLVRDGGGNLDDYHSLNMVRNGGSSYDRKAGEKQLRRSASSLRTLLFGDPPRVDRIDRDRLIVGDGLLAACAAKAREDEWIKVRMPSAVATDWDARPTGDLDEVCRLQERDQIYTPVMHPAYRKFKYSRRGFRRLDLIRRHLGTDVRGKTLLDIGCNCGYYVFHFYRQGMDVTGIDMDEGHLAIARAQVPMYDAEVRLLNVAVQDFETERPFDVVLSMSVFWHMLGWGKLPQSVTEQELCEIIDRIVGDRLYWESGPEPDREITLIRENTRLKRFEKLGTTSATGIDERVFGVFSREAA